MELNFEVISEVGTGEYPDVVHFANTQAQVFNIKEGELYAMPSDKIENGEWQNTIFQDELEASPDEGMSHFELKVLPGWGIIGGYKTGNFHKMIIYEFAFEMDRFLSNGSIKHSIDTPISSFTLSLENPDLKDPEKPGNVAINEENSLLSPGAKVQFRFGAGEEEPEFEMGNFYVDRSNFTLLRETANVDGRNKIGKILKEQSVDELNEFWLQPISNTHKELLTNANLTNEEFSIEHTGKEYWFNFAPDTPIYSAIEKTFEVLPNWKMRENVDGVIVIGSDSYSEFGSNGLYVFKRDKDIFSRQIAKDDGEVYRRICVHTKNYSIVEYRDVQNYQSWNLQAKKTLYVEVVEGSSPEDVEAYADEVELRMANVGKVESFTGPFRPHLTVGDGAIIIDSKGSEDLGLITEITHSFGKGGYTTNFTVDSGGLVGKGRLSDFIKRIAIGSGGGDTKIGWNDIDMDRYENIAKVATVTATSSISDLYTNPSLVVDGETTREPEWTPVWTPNYTKDNTPSIKLDFKQRCLVDKIVVFPNPWSRDNPIQYSDIMTKYDIDYFNGSFWVHLLEQTFTQHINSVEHNFDAIYTSAIRIRVPSNRRSRIREIEIYGNM